MVGCNGTANLVGEGAVFGRHLPFYWNCIIWPDQADRNMARGRANREFQPHVPGCAGFLHLGLLYLETVAVDEPVTRLYNPDQLRADRLAIRGKHGDGSGYIALSLA